MNKKYYFLLTTILTFALILPSCKQPNDPLPPNEADYNFIITGGLLAGTQAVGLSAAVITISGPSGVSFNLTEGDGTNDLDNDKFNFVENRLVVGPATLHEGSYNVYIEVSNSSGSFNKAVEITVLAAPEFGSSIVYFNKNGGDTEADPIIKVAIPPKTTIDKLPEAPTKNGFTFAGWNTQADGEGSEFTEITPVNADITLYAMWEFHVPGATLAAKLQWLRSNAKSNSEYTLALNSEPESIGPQNLSYSGKSNVTVILRSNEAEKVISLSSNGPLFSVGSGVTLILDKNITLKGRDNNDSLVVIGSDGNFIINDEVKIIGNNCKTTIFPTWFNAGGVSVLDGGKFTMQGGEISGNYKDNYGGGSGGVSVLGGGIFIMNDGKISGNTTDSGGGGGILIWEDGNFTMNGGIISNNTAEFGHGGGVAVFCTGAFTLNNGEISSNKSGNNNTGGFGGGVSICDYGTFTMNDGKISDNTGSSGGGVGVLPSFNSTFTMSGGTISGNTASGEGGGVVIANEGTFTKTGNSTIYGNAAGDYSNTAAGGSGHAVYIYNNSSPKRRETTAGHGVNLDSTKDGAAGGWED